MTAEEASKKTEEIILSQTTEQKIQKEIESIEFWIDLASKNGQDHTHWFVPEDSSKESTVKILFYLKSNGFEVVKYSGLITMYKILW